MNLQWLDTLTRKAAHTTPGVNSGVDPRLMSQLRVLREGPESVRVQGPKQAYVQGRAIPRQRVLKIDASLVPEESGKRGSGLGLAMYLKMLEEADRMGRPLTSDATVSREASNIYAALARRGRRVLRSPMVQDLGDRPADMRSSMQGPLYAVLPKDSGYDWANVLEDYVGRPRNSMGRQAGKEIPAIPAEVIKRMSPEEFAKIFGAIGALGGLSAAAGAPNDQSI